mgnify:CR=1 FL=1
MGRATWDAAQEIRDGKISREEGVTLVNKYDREFPERYFLGLSVAQELRLGHKRLTTEEQISTLKKVGLIDLDLKKPPESLSGGQQRRLAIAVQLLRSPKVLLLDEPTAGLDWSVRNGIIELLAKLKDKQTIFIVTHAVSYTHLRAHET